MDHTVNTSCPETSGVTPPPFATSVISSCPSTPGVRNFDILGGRTAKEHEKEYEDMRKENFSLKLRIFLLEEKISETVGRDVAETIQQNVQLRITLDALQKEAKCKERVLEETVKVAKDNEAAYKKAVRKIESLQREIDILKEELEGNEKYCTPQQSGSETEMFKEAFDICGRNQSTNSARLSDGMSIEELKKELAELETEGIVKELENKQLKVLNKQKDEAIENLKIRIIKRNKVIQRLTDRLQSCPGSEDMLHAVNEGIKAAKRKDIQKVLESVNEIKQKFSELVSMNSGDLFQETFNEASLIASTAIKDRNIQDSKCSGNKQMKSKSSQSHLWSFVPLSKRMRFV